MKNKLSEIIAAMVAAFFFAWTSFYFKNVKEVRQKRYSGQRDWIREKRRRWRSLSKR